MPPIDTIDLAYGIPLIVVVPALIQIAKANGLPTRLAGPAAILTATALIALGDIALAAPSEPIGQRLAAWVIGGIVYGLAAAGFYSLAPFQGGGILPTSNASTAGASGERHEPRNVTARRPADSGR